VATAEAPDHTRFAAIRDLVAGSRLPKRTRDRSLEVLSRLAEAEGWIHDVPTEEVELHELGAVDTLVDVCGAILLFDELGVGQVGCCARPSARGAGPAGEGRLPVPARATLALLVGAPLAGVEGEGELVPPTGAAIAAAVVSSWGELPPLTLDAVGYGAGSR